MVPRGSRKVKGTSMNGPTHFLLQGSLMNRKQANQAVKGTPMNTFSNLSALRQKQSKNVKHITFKDRKKSALERIMETVNRSKAKNELERMAIPNSPDTILARDLQKAYEKEQERQEKFRKLDEEDEVFDAEMERIHNRHAKSSAFDNGFNVDMAGELQNMSEQAERKRTDPNEPSVPNTLPFFPGLVELKPKKTNPKPRGKAVPRRTKTNGNTR
jgi:hypothetical protein